MSDLMLVGVLRMLHAVYPDAPPAEPITWRQVVGRCSEAADRIEADAGEIDRLRAENERLRQHVKRFKASEVAKYEAERGRLKAESLCSLAGTSVLNQ